MPALARRQVVHRRPPIQTSPVVAVSSPAMMRSSVVLPQPEAPEQHHELPVGDGQIDRMQRGEAAEGLARRP